MVESRQSSRQQLVENWVVSWKILLISATVFMLGSVIFGGWGIATLPDDQGHAAGFAGMAFLFFAVVGIVVFLAALPLAYLLKRDGICRIGASLFIMLGGTFVYVSSGFFVGFLPVFLLAVAVGGLGVSEEYLTTRNDAA